MPLTPVYNLLSTQVPAIQVATVALDPTIDAPVPTTASTVLAGAQGSGSLTTPVNANAVRIDILGRWGAGGICVAHGFDLEDSTGLTLVITAGTILADGPVVVTEDQTKALPNNTNTYVWATQAGVITLRSNTTAPTGDANVYLGRVTTSGGSITEIDYSGRMEARGRFLWRRVADVGEPADTPPATLAFFVRTGGGLYWWDGVSYEGGGIDAQNVLVSADDTNATYLEGALSAGAGIQITKLNPGADEELELAVALEAGSVGTTELADGAVTVAKLAAGLAHRAKVSSNDTTGGLLNGKLVAGTGVSLTENNDGSNETLTIAANPAGILDGKAKVSSDDTTAGFLNGKLTAGTGITLTEGSGGGNETLSIAANPSAILDGKAKVSSNDTTPNFLGSKLVAGANVTITENNDGANETLTIAATGGGGSAYETQNLGTYVVSVTPNSDKVLKLDFATLGSFGSAGYHVWVDADQVPPYTQISEVLNDKTASVLFLRVENAQDATSGGYGTSSQIQITVYARGEDWTAGAGEDATLTEYTVDYFEDAEGDGEWTAPLGAFFMDDIDTNLSGLTQLKNAWMGGIVCPQGMINNRFGGKVCQVVTTFSSNNWGDSDAEIELTLTTTTSTGTTETITLTGITEAATGSAGVSAQSLQSLGYPLDTSNFMSIKVSAELVGGTLNNNITMGVVLYGLSGDSSA